MELKRLTTGKDLPSADRPPIISLAYRRQGRTNFDISDYFLTLFKLKFNPIKKLKIENLPYFSITVRQIEPVKPASLALL
jgi:hypothetical protein